ncbi:MAG TPA: biotin/lipoate A/B protein ligase family protein [Candidatus Binatia bacterium]|nr:biotin/lipoate A/B protein ligase family protein [Candidatus Binatia bacterium]
MKYLDLSFADPAANLACDEALLELFETEKPNDGILRVWEPTTHFVVLGHSNRLRTETNQAACAENKIPILRRISGGGAVMQGPGCVNYSLILDIHAHGLRNIRDAFRYVLQRHSQFIDALSGAKTSIEGISDLVVAGRKFSGNAQYRKSRFVLVHGTFLLRFDLSLIDRHLKIPAKQPDYRLNRPHLEFLINLKLDSGRVRESLRAGWSAAEELFPVPFTRIEALVKERYAREEWSGKF